MSNGVGRTRVAVFWHLESCPIPEDIEPSLVRRRMEATLKQYGYCGPLTIRAYGKLEYHTKEACRFAGIDVIKFERVQDTAEKCMLAEISDWISSNRCPVTCMLISEDLGFSYLVGMLKQRGHNFLLTHPNPRVSKLLGAARHVWGWPQLLLDEKPLLAAAFCTSLDGDNSISNLSSYPNSYDNQDIGFPFLVILIILCDGICKQLGLISHHKILDLLLFMELLTFILDDLDVINVFGGRHSVHGGAGLFKIVGGIQDINLLGLIGFAACIGVNKNLGLLVLPTILCLPLNMLVLLEIVQWLLWFAGAFILVIWDFENCRLPRRVSPYSISRKIRVYLKNCGYFGHVIIRAYGDTNSLAPSDLRALSKEIDVIHVDPGKDAADKRIMVDLPFLAWDDMSAGIFMLISGDGDFIHLVRLLVQRGFKFVHCNPKDGASAFRPLADSVCNWPDIVTQKPSQPLLMNAASASHPSDHSISNVIPFQSSSRQQTVVPDNHSVQDIVLIILVIAAFLLVGASKPLPRNLCPDCGDAAAVLETSVFLLDDLGVITLFGKERRSTYRVSENAGVPNRSLTGALWVLGLICAFLGCLQANKRLELWLLPESVNFILHCQLLVFMEQYFEILKFFGWRV